MGVACKLPWRCDGCVLTGQRGVLEASYGVEGTYAYGINWNVTSSSGFGPGTGNGGGCKCTHNLHHSLISRDVSDRLRVWLQTLASQQSSRTLVKTPVYQDTSSRLQSMRFEALRLHRSPSM